MFYRQKNIIKSVLQNSFEKSALSLRAIKINLNAKSAEFPEFSKQDKHWLISSLRLLLTFSDVVSVVSTNILLLY